MITRKVTVTVAKPSAQVFKFVGADYFVNHPKWDPKVVNIKLDSPGPVGVGTSGQETRKQGRGTVTYSFKVTDFKPGSQMAFQASGGP